MQRNVVYLCEFPTLLGGERSLLTFLAHRAAASVNPTVVAPSGGRLAAALDTEGIPRIDWPAGGRRRPAGLAAALRDRACDIVHANSLMTADAALTVGEALRIPAVAHVRDIMTLSAAQRERLCRLDRIIAVSEAVAGRLVEQGIPAANVTRIYNAVDADALRQRANPGSVRRELALDKIATLVGCIGQIALRKGQDLFLDAAARVATNLRHAHFVIAGERYSDKPESRSFEADLIARSSTPPLAGRTHWLGYRDDVPSILADLDVIVVPSRQEPLSRVLLESLAIGTPAVATDVGGTPEIVVDGETGLRVPPDDPAEMANAIECMITDASMRKRIHAAGPHRARAMFSPTRQVREIRSLYVELLRTTAPDRRTSK